MAFSIEEKVLFDLQKAMNRFIYYYHFIATLYD